MTRWSKKLLMAAAAMFMGTAAAFAQDTGTSTSGNWEDGAIWTSGTVPGSSNNVFIGSMYPAGSAATATVTLTTSESAGNVYLGYGNNGGTGTLDLGNNSLTIAGTLYIGQNGGTGILQEGAGGSFTAQGCFRRRAATPLNLRSQQTRSPSPHPNKHSTATTAAAGNVTGSVYA